MIALVIFIMIICYGAFTIHLINHFNISSGSKFLLVLIALLTIHLVSMIAAVDILGAKSLPDPDDFWYYPPDYVGEWNEINFDPKHQVLALALSLGVVFFFDVIIKIITYKRAVIGTITPTLSKSSVVTRICLTIGTIAALMTIYYQLIIPFVKGSFP